MGTSPLPWRTASCCFYCEPLLLLFFSVRIWGGGGRRMQWGSWVLGFFFLPVVTHMCACNEGEDEEDICCVWAFAVSFGDSWHPQLVLHPNALPAIHSAAGKKPSPKTTHSNKDHHRHHHRSLSNRFCQGCSRSLSPFVPILLHFFRFSSTAQEYYDPSLSSVSVSWVLPTTTHPNLHKGDKTLE